MNSLISIAVVRRQKPALIGTRGSGIGACASAKLAPNMLAAFGYDLAAHFSDFYEHTPPIVKETDEHVKAFRAWLVSATVQTMGNALRLLGFVPLESM